MTLYKYRSIRRFKNFVDIIINQRLYAAPYFDLNDPMEGQYIYPQGTLSSSVIKAIKGEKENIRICSLSRTYENSLMWAHYADGHRGVVIGVNVDNTKYEVHKMEYEGLSYVRNVNIDGSTETAKRILCHKNEIWSYEQEERIFVTGKTKFVEVKITEVIIGSRMRQQDKNLVKDLISKILPEVKVEDSNIENIV